MRPIISCISRKSRTERHFSPLRYGGRYCWRTVGRGATCCTLNNRGVSRPCSNNWMELSWTFPAKGMALVGEPPFSSIGADLRRFATIATAISFLLPLGAGLSSTSANLGSSGRLGRDPNDHQVKAANLAALCWTFGAAGAECLVVVGSVDNQAAAELYRRALEGATVVVCRLHASSAVLAERVMLRGQGRNWPEPGDPLKGRAAASLSAAAGKAASEAEDLDDSGLGDVCIDTDGRSVEEVADAIVARANGWPAK